MEITITRKVDREGDYWWMAMLMAGLASLVPMVLDFDSFLAILGLPVLILFAFVSLGYGLIGCAIGSRFHVMALSAPLLGAYILFRPNINESISLLSHAADGTRFDNIEGMPDTAVAIFITAVLVVCVCIAISCAGRWRIRSTSPWYLAATTVSVVCILWDLRGCQAIKERSGRQAFFVVPTFWLLVSSLGFAWLSISEMWLRQRIRPRLLSAVAVVTGAATITSALAVGLGIVRDSVLDAYHIEAMGAQLGIGWVASLYVVFGVVIMGAGLRSRPIRSIEKGDAAT